MRNYNYVLVVGTEDSRKMRTITEALEKRYWGYYEAIGNGGKAEEFFEEQRTQYRLVVVTGRFGWWRLANEQNPKMQSITMIEYIDSFYNASACELPDIIIYEPNKRNRTLIADQGFRSEMAKRTPKVWLVGNEKALDEALTEWWLKVNCGE